MEEKPKPNYFVRTLISVLATLLAGMVAFKFLAISPKGDVSAGLLTLIGLLIVLVLSESFDNFSVGKLISVTREAKKKEKDVEKLEREKNELFAQLMSLSVSQSQNQTHTNVYGDYNAAIVSKATGSEIEEKRTSESAAEAKEDVQSTVPSKVDAEEGANPPNEEVTPSEEPKYRLNQNKAEDIAFHKYFGTRGLETLRITREVKLTEREQAFDPIATVPVIFDAYVQDGPTETFVEFKSSNLSLMFRDRLYVMLSKVHHYRISKRAEVSLDLVLIKIPNERQRFGGSERILRDYGPSLTSGLLKVTTIELTEEEAESCREPWQTRYESSYTPS